jgi:hypothetical protein
MADLLVLKIRAVEGYKMRMKNIALIVVGVVAPVMAHASSVTYDFTGTVYSGNGNLVGTTVTGTYTFDYSNAISDQSSGTIGSASGWSSEAIGGSGENSPLPVPAGLVFSSTAQDGQVSYVSAAPSSYQSGSAINGNSQTGSYSFGAVEQQIASSGASTASGMGITSSGTAPWSSDGLPLFVANSSGTGYFDILNSSGAGTIVDYTITSLTPAPVPLPATAWLMLSGLGGLGTFARKKLVA